MTTQAARRYTGAERSVQAAMYVLLGVGVFYLIFAFDHLQPSWMLGWGVIFGALIVAKIALAQKAARPEVRS